jgi:uncharacterized protein with gpF-like domain
MTDEEIQSEFEASVRRILAQVENRELASIQRAIDLLDQVRREVIARIAEGGSNFTATVYQQVERSINQALEKFRQDLQVQMTDDLSQMADIGAQLVDEPIKVIVGTEPLISVSKEIAQVAAAYLPGLIEGITSDLRNRIAGILRRAVLGAISTQEAIDEVGRNLTDTGVFKTVASRAETIVRTEVLRIQSIATQARMQANAKKISEFGWNLRREWTTAHDANVRLAHQFADGQQVGVDENFVVSGEELQYPRDPAGSPGNTINCRCIARPIVSRQPAEAEAA